MGSAAVRLFASQGFRVFALDVKPCAESDNVIRITADITSEASVREAFGRISAVSGGLYAIVHFAGIYALDSLAEMSAESFDRIFSVNLRGAFLINKIFLPLLSSGSRILITTSELAALDPLPFTGVYAVTKAALDKYAYSLCMELQLLGIKVSVLRAGAVETGMLGVSTRALEDFCRNTRLYSCNAKRFKAIVDRVEARSVAPERIACAAARILRSPSPAFAYSVNRNPLLLMLDAMPKRAQLWVIKQVLRNK
jgi:NAD(P)-dependent dehydrogenase (short-subunit alcohol dehydrogenase family)